MSRRKRRQLRNRRIAAIPVFLLAVALGVFALRMGAGVGVILMIAGAVLLALLAVALLPRRGMPAAFYILIALLGIALAGGGYVHHNYALTDGRFVPRYALARSLRVDNAYPEHFTGMTGLEALDMRASTVDDFSPISALSGLKELDVRENYAFTEADYQALTAALPGCHIRWSVPLGNTYFDSDAQTVDATAQPLSVQELKALFARYPDKSFTYLVPLLEGRYAVDTEALDLRGQAVDAQTLGEALSLLTRVTRIDLRGVPMSAGAIGSLWNTWPDIRFMCSCDVPFGELTTEDSMVTLTGSYEDIAACLAYVDYMPNLERIDASAIGLTWEQADALVATGHADRLIYSVSVFGKRVSSANTELDLDGIKLNSVEEVESCLARLPNIRKISMCNCGLSDEQMGQLFDAHPEVKFVWWIQFGQYKLRTDATAFTTGLGDGNKFNYTSATFAPLRYCTDLMMLDLGHNQITSIEGLRGLTKLRVLILADNKITDISALEGLKDLEYVELFLNDITDLTPLADKEKLVDLNIYYNPIGSGYQTLKSITSLKRLWIGGCRLSGDMLADLQQALPNTKINVKGRGSTGEGWRKHPHYDTLVKMYEEERYIPFDD